MCRIKSEKEQLRKAEEMKIELQRRQEEKKKEMEERECLILERLRLDEDEAAEEVKRREKTKKSKETKRYLVPIYEWSCYGHVFHNVTNCKHLKKKSKEK